MKVYPVYFSHHLAYNQSIRLWKSRLGLIYIENQSLIMDIQIIFYTPISLISKQISIDWIVKKLIKFKAEKELIKACKRDNKLVPFPPLGQENIVMFRDST